jgi:hypothetical protein
MEKRKVYVVRRHYWRYNFGDSDWSDEVLDSIWSRQEDAKHRIDDLANEYVRQQWYEQVCDLEDIEDFECKTEWAEDGLSVKMSTDSYEADTFYVDEFELDPLLPDFEGP